MTVDSQVATNTALTCIAPGCTRPPRRATGLECSMHRGRRQRLGSYDLPPQRSKVEHGRCAAPGCDRDATLLAKSGWHCSKHYNRIKRHGSTELPEGSTPHTRKSTDPCAAPGCDRLQWRKGYCMMHHARVQQHGSTELPQRARTPLPPCAAPHCGRRARGYSGLSVYCGKHFRQAQTRGVDGMAAVREHVVASSGINDGDCRVDGCDHPARQRGLCGMHYQRWQQSSTTDSPPKPPLVNGGTCSVPDCPTLAACRGMCSMHYSRQYLTGSLEAPVRVQPTCAVVGCTTTTRHGGRGWCPTHYKRWQAHGDPLVVKTTAGPRLGNDIGYLTAHSRVKHERGAPSTYTCVDCGRQAEDWAYANSGIGEKVGDRGYRFSVDITQYDPMCKLCHSRRDRLAVVRRQHGDVEPACAAPGCERSLRTTTALECDMHYQRRRNYGSYDLPERPKKQPGPCAAEGCERRALGYTGNAVYCSTHSQRVAKWGSVAAPPRRDAPTGARQPRTSDTPCSMPDCARPVQARGWCSTHYRRWHKTGSTELSEHIVPVCAVDGCTSSTRPGGRGWCSKHYQRWCRRGDPVTVKPRSSTPMGDDVGYMGAHARVRKEHGVASAHPCVECGQPAQHWAYTNSGIGEKVDDRGYRYSVDTAQYDPMCRRCHRRRDGLEEAWRRRAAIAASGSSPAAGDTAF